MLHIYSNEITRKEKRRKKKVIKRKQYKLGLEKTLYDYNKDITYYQWL